MDPDRDRAIESMLGDALKRQNAAARTAACLDAETAAAWADGALSDRDRSRVEGHVASCARCQALVAALVQTAPPVPARLSWFRLPRIAWLAPLTAVAAALIVWAIVPAPAEKSAAPVLPQARNAPADSNRPVAEVRPQAASAPSVPSPPANEAVPQAKQREKAFADRRQDVDALKKNQDAKLAETAKLKDEIERQPPADQARAAQLQAPPPAAASPPAAPPPVAAPAEPKRDARRGGAVAAGAVAAAPPAASSADLAMRKSVAESVTVTGAAPLAQRSVSPTMILSPDVDQRWRIVNSNPGGSVVDHSTDGGRQWAAQPIGDRTIVTMGASPSPSVCWLVGPQGTVLLTTTRGAAWQRLAFPETVDLVTVRATDEANATVTAIDGRAFATTDRGVTWKSVVKP